MLVLTIYNTKYIIVNVYLPPPSEIQVLYSLYERLAPHCPARILFIGDFNATLSRDLDRPFPQSNFSPELGTWAQATEFTKTWRWLHPQDRTYSCFSTTFKTSSSRIDLAFANAALLNDIQEACYLPSGLSDHNPLKLTIITTRSRNRALWRLQPHWINNESVHARVSPQLQEYWAHNAESASLEMVWDAFKAHSRG